MTREELIEKVARIIVGDDLNSDFKLHNGQPYWKSFENDATIAIDIVLEEAAKVASEKADAVSVSKYLTSRTADAVQCMALEIEEAIRALKGE